MRKRFALLLFALATTSAAKATVAVSHLIKPIPKEMALLVEAEVKGLAADARPVFRISEQFGSANDFYKDVENLTITFPANQKFKSEKPTEWELTADTVGDTLRFEYRIKIRQSFPGAIRFKPSLNANGYYSNGYPLFILPVRYSDTG